jgi:hypothetical protein
MATYRGRSPFVTFPFHSPGVPIPSRVWKSPLRSDSIGDLRSAPKNKFPISYRNEIPIDTYVAKAKENFDTLFETFKTYSENGWRVGNVFDTMTDYLFRFPDAERSPGYVANWALSRWRCSEHSEQYVLVRRLRLVGNRQCESLFWTHTQASSARFGASSKTSPRSVGT